MYSLLLSLLLGSAGAWSVVDIQTFTGGAGAYTWTKPSGANYVCATVILAGGGGGSGGAVASDSGGGGGGGGAYLSQCFDASQLTRSVTVTLGLGGIGGVGVIANNGNIGSQGGATSFGAYLAGQVPAGNSGSGGTNAAGAGGNCVVSGLANLTSAQSLACVSGGNGDDTASGSDAAHGGTGTTGPGIYMLTGLTPSGGGGGGGTNGGANFTAGGAGGAGNGSQGVACLVRNEVAGAVADGVAGSDGLVGGWDLANACAYVMSYGGMGGSGGAGSVVAATNGGKGGNGGNCGGGGGGGGASLSGTSGAGGNGGDGCAFVISF